jgi:hypothetical protein
MSSFPEVHGSAIAVSEAVGDADAIALDVEVDSTAAGVGASSGELHAAIANNVTIPVSKPMAVVRKLDPPTLTGATLALPIVRLL